ncbi:MAG: Cna B-type domain-containing protein [Clostridiales bacterium]|nr:Cna B-type domain-containing protein [Clostridiales bacterium]
MKRALTIGLCLLMLCAALLPAIAIGQRMGMVNVSLKFEGSPVEGATLTVYQIGRTKQSGQTGEFEAIEPYTQQGISFENFTIEKGTAVIEKLAAVFAKPNSLEGVSMTTDANGQATWSSLAHGIYYIRQTKSEGMADEFEFIAPFLVAIPVMNSSSTHWAETIEAFPKLETTPTPTPSPAPSTPPLITLPPTDPPVVPSYPSYINLVVTKSWKDSSDADALRPKNIVIHLYQKLSSALEYDTTPYLTVDMAGVGNEWKFTFYDLVRYDSSGNRYDYLVREVGVNGYETKYDKNGFTITNIHATPTPDPNITPPPVTTSFITPPPTPSPSPQPLVPVSVRYVDEEWVYYDDYGTPLGALPQTSDESDMMLYVVAAFVLMGAACILAMLLYRRRRKNQ